MPVVKDVRVNPEVGAAQVALTDVGRARLPARLERSPDARLGRAVDGRETPVGAPPRAYSLPRVSPDGTRIAVTMKESGQDIHLWDVARGVLRQLTFDRVAEYDRGVVERVSDWRTRVRSTAGGRRSSSGPTVSEAARQVTNGTALVPVTPASRDGTVLIVREDSRLTAPGTSASCRLRASGRASDRRADRRRPRTTRSCRPTAGGLRISRTRRAASEIYARPFPPDRPRGDRADRRRAARARSGRETAASSSTGPPAARRWLSTAFASRRGRHRAGDAPRVIVQGPYRQNEHRHRLRRLGRTLSVDEGLRSRRHAARPGDRRRPVLAAGAERGSCRSGEHPPHQPSGLNTFGEGPAAASREDV